MKMLCAALALCMLLTAGAGYAEAAAANPVADAYERASASVVQVRNMKETWSPETGPATEISAYGSGVCVEAGFILTNWHVVYEADFVEVETLDGQIARARNIFSDDSVDLAVIELETAPEGLVPATLGDSEAVRPGDLALVIGSPVLDNVVFPGTLSVGYVSGVNRPSRDMGYFSRAVPLIQLDAALNAGTSGAGVFNTAGELIGLAALKAGEVDGIIYEGLGFAIPAATIGRVAGDLVAHGVVRRPRMGVMVSDLDGPEEPIRTYPPSGLLASEVDPEGPAARAGMMLNDIIVEFDGVRVHDFTELSALLDTHQAGEVVHVKVYRCLDEMGYMIDNPEYVELDITLGILD